MQTIALFCLVCLIAVSSESVSAEKAPPRSVDLRPRFEKLGLTPRQQGRRGTCSVFTVAGALEYALAKRKGTRLSVEFLNWAGHKAAHRSADGGFFSELWQGYEAYGVCPEADSPYRAEFDASFQPPLAALKSAEKLRRPSLRLHWIKEWNPNTGLTPAQFLDLKRTLAKKIPVCGGFRWPMKAVWEEGVLQLCPAEEVFDGHSVLLAGYRDDPALPGGGVFIIRNSGGDGADGFLPYAYAEKYMNDAAWIGEEKQEAVKARGVSPRLAEPDPSLVSLEEAPLRAR